MSHSPQRSAARKTSTSDDVFKGFRTTRYTDQAKSGRTYGVSERRPFGSGHRPTDNRGGTR